MSGVVTEPPSTRTVRRCTDVIANPLPTPLARLPIHPSPPSKSFPGLMGKVVSPLPISDAAIIIRRTLMLATDVCCLTPLHPPPSPLCSARIPHCLVQGGGGGSRSLFPPDSIFPGGITGYVWPKKAVQDARRSIFKKTSSRSHSFSNAPPPPSPKLGTNSHGVESLLPHMQVF